MDTHRASAGRTTPPFSNSLSGPACSPTTGGSQRQDKAVAASLRVQRKLAPGLSPLARTQSQRTSGTRRIGRKGTSGWAPAVHVPGVPTGCLCSPVQHFADPLAHASPGGGRQAHATAALSWQVLDGGHHMVRRGRWRWWLQLGLRRLWRDHRGGGGGGWLSEGCPTHSARAPGPGNTQRTWPSSPGPGRRCRLRSDEAGDTGGLRPPPPKRSALGLLPSPGCTPSLRVAAATSRPGSSRAATQVLAHPAKWLQRGSAGTRSCRVLCEERAERGTGLPGFVFPPSAWACPGGGSCGGAASAGAGVRLESCRLCLTE